MNKKGETDYEKEKKSLNDKIDKTFKKCRVNHQKVQQKPVILVRNPDVENKNKVSLFLYLPLIYFHFLIT